MSDKNETMMMMSCSMGDDMNISNDAVNAVFSGDSSNGGNVIYTAKDDVVNAFYDITPWNYWQNHYYPNVIRESYPVYIKERAEDKGKQAFEIIKILKDKKLVNLKEVGDFIQLMDELIKIL